MTSRVAALLTCLVVAAGPAAVRAADGQTPAFTLQIRSLDRVLEDVKYLAKLAGKEEEAKQLDGLVKSRMGPKGLEGVDTKRPLGMYSVLKRNANVALIPIASEEAFLGLLESLNIKATKCDDGIYTVSTEALPVSVYFRFAHQYAYVTAPTKAALDKDNLLDPATVLPPNDANLVTAVWRLDQIPDALKQVGLQQMDVRFGEEERKKQPGETEAQRNLRVQMLKSISEQLALLVKEGNRLELRFNVDRQKEELVAEASLSGQSGSRLAAEIDGLGRSRSLFAGLGDSNAAAGLFVHVALPDSVRNALGPVIDEGIRQGVANEKDDAKRRQTQRLLDAIRPTLKAGELDWGFRLTGPSDDRHYSFVAGVKLRDGQSVEKALRGLIKNLPPREQSLIKVDADNAGDVAIHRIDAQKAFDANARQTLGDNPLYVAVRKDAIWFSGGPDGLAVLKSAVTAKPQAGPQLRLDLAMARLAPTIARGNKGHEQEILDLAGKTFRGADREKDRASFVVEGGKALRARLVLPGPVIRFLAAMPKQPEAAKPGDEK